MNILDLSLHSLYRINGQERPLLPGLLAQTPPKRVARGREQDRLLVYLTLAGNLPFSTADYQQITTQIANAFYNTSGSLTFALKTAVDALNTFLVERNMRTTGQGQYSMGALVLAALRGESLYFVQSGPTHAFWLSQGNVTHYHDTNMAGKGLGLSQTTRAYFAQVELRPGDQVLFCAALPPNWEKALTDNPTPASPEVLHRRLMAVAKTNISATLIQVTQGSGNVSVVQPVRTPVDEEKAPTDAPQPAKPAPAPVHTEPEPAYRPQPVRMTTPIAPEKEDVLAEADPEEEPIPVIPSIRPEPVHAETYPPMAATILPEPEFETQEPPKKYAPEPKVLVTPEQKQKMEKVGRGTARFLARGIQSGRSTSQKASETINNLLTRMLPIEDGSSPALSARWMIFIALAIPLLIVTMASTVYFEFGQGSQYETYYNRAVETAMQTLNVNDPTSLRKYWNDTLDWLDKAEQFQQTAESQRLRQEAQRSLDSLDRVTRLDYKVAFSTQLSRNLQVTQMAASDTDVYLLNDIDGSVLRGVLNGNTYDPQEFNCSKGEHEGGSIGPLVDILALPRSNPSGATLLGIDANGTLIYCSPSGAPTVFPLQPPDIGWGRVTAMAYDAGTLYVLDAGKNAVWVYFAQPGIQFADKPLFFFEEQVPPMADVLGMAVNADDLYLLHQDGHLTTCTLSRIFTAPTRCVEPARFIDTRPGYESGPKLADGVFTQIVFTPAPDPAVTLLEPFTQSLFRFSPRQLELQNQLRARPGKDNPFPEGLPVTSMTFSPNKVVFVFVGGVLYQAVLSP